ncbi:alpha/beta hydrolase [Endozoicomonas sp. SM1973]|uniref:Alpha/beta hydrolase n=1 Tax=Spartinivicinus marinus TaxID=2994442 RepID=A0A853IN57_9GAMM|nr:alpha/beta hydrolase [Spartinivicinus marinus]MCX4027702.1 alpha/beta hydrolase [Spartinivicinus marinus]NYZ69256.1 alpha/beta hydrolase [Spartinivicinus marinus]
MLNEKWLEIEGDKLYCLFSTYVDSQDTLVFIHGLGESHLCFSDAIDWLPNYNLVLFDMCGYGYSPASHISHSTETQAKRILKALKLLGIDKCFLLGHSWGGDTSTLVCQLDRNGIIQGFINAEGGLHEENVVLSKIISEQYSCLNEQEFDYWVKGNGFAKQFSLSWRHGAGIKYLSSVRRCESIVLGETASEIYSQHATQDSRGVVSWGRVYEELSIPKIYFWGSKSLEGCERALKFIKTLDNVRFEGANHWVQNEPSRFYAEVEKFISNAK